MAANRPMTETGLPNMGRVGWVSARFDGDDEVSLDVLGTWLGESYRAIAPMRLVAALRHYHRSPNAL